MARFLAIDWDPPKLNVLGANIGKGKARAEQSLALPLSQELTAASAAAQGKALKDALAQAGIAPAPVLFALERDRVIIKELTIPFVPAHEEPTVVRFQAAKEMTDAAHDVVLDYCLLAPPKAGQPTPVQVVIVRKAIVAAITALCQAAGLKLHSIVPRPFALAGLLDRKTPSTIPITRGLLVPTGLDEVEFCVYSAHRLVWARTLSADPGLANEVQKNLVLLATQKIDLPEVQKIETTGIVGLGDLGVAKEPLEPWRDNDTPPQNPAAFLGALGLAESAARAGGLPINLAAPKEPKPVVDNSARRKKFAIGTAAIVVPVLLVGWFWNLSKMDGKIKRLLIEKEELVDKWTKSEPERIDVAGLKDWDNSKISWLDLLFDIAARMPHQEGLRITKLIAKETPRAGKSGYTGHITISGEMKKDTQHTEVTKFAEAMRQDNQFLRVGVPNYPSRSTEFQMPVEVAPRPPEKYTAKLVVPSKAAQAFTAREAAIAARMFETAPEKMQDAEEEGDDEQ